MTSTHKQKSCTTSENNGSKATVWTTTQSKLMEECDSPSPTSEKREEERCSRCNYVNCERWIWWDVKHKQRWSLNRCEQMWWKRHWIFGLRISLTIVERFLVGSCTSGWQIKKLKSYHATLHAFEKPDIMHFRSSLLTLPRLEHEVSLNHFVVRPKLVFSY